MLTAFSVRVDAVQFGQQNNALLLVWISARDHGDYRVGRTGVIWQMGNVCGYIEKVAWPNNRIAVMGPEQAAGVLAIVTEEKLKRDGKPVDGKKLDAMKAAVVGRMEKESTALFATARLWDDGLIDPRDSRKVLALCLSICREAQVRPLKPNTFGVARM